MKSYGKGVEGILMKNDSSLPLFVAIVYIESPVFQCKNMFFTQHNHFIH